MGMCIIFWMVMLREVGKRVPKLSFISALGPISACVIGERHAGSVADGIVGMHFVLAAVQWLLHMHAC